MYSRVCVSCGALLSLCCVACTLSYTEEPTSPLSALSVVMVEFSLPMFQERFHTLLILKFEDSLKFSFGATLTSVRPQNP
jgi:hypothetical protein